MKPGRRRVASGVAFAAALAACGTSTPSSFTVPTAQAGSVTTASTTAPVATVQCPPGIPAVASYRPTAPLPAPGNLPPGSYMATIRQRGKLRVGTSADVLQFGARNPLTGTIEGFDIDMLREVSKAIFGDDRDLDFSIINYAQRIPKIRSNSVDIVAHTMTINCTRWTQVAFSTEYYHAGQTVLVRSDNTADRSIQDLDRDHKRVCVAKGSTNIDNIKQYTHLVAVPVDDLGTCLVLFQQGSVDAITGDDTVLAGFAKQDAYAKVMAKTFTDEPYGLAMSLQHRDFVEFVNALLERMRSDGTLARVYCRWLPNCTQNNTVPPKPLPVAVYGR